MRDSIYRYTLDMYDVASQVQITAKKNDSARKIYVTLTENGKPYTIENGCRAVFMMKKPDATTLYNDCYIIDSGKIIAYDFTTQTTSVVGLCECEIRLYGNDDTIITSPRFTILVNETVYADGQVTSDSEFSALTSALTSVVNLDIDAEKEDHTSTVTVTKQDGTEKTVLINDGSPGAIISETEPTGANRLPIWIKPGGNFVPISVGGGTSVIDDTETSNNKTWSSGKIYNELNAKVTSDEVESMISDAIGGALNGSY